MISSECCVTLGWFRSGCSDPNNQIMVHQSPGGYSASDLGKSETLRI